MPRAKAKSSAELSIELTDDCQFYSPGSKVSGNVVLNTAQDFAIGFVNIEFYGRVKVHYVNRQGQGESHHRGRAPLFSSALMLYQGHHTHRPGTFSWPFVFEIPTSPDIATLHSAKHQWKEKDHFLATEDYAPSHSIPPTFKMNKLAFGYRLQAFVEYVLIVEVKEAQGASMVLPLSSRKAVLPITVTDVASVQSNRMRLPLGVQFTMPGQLNEKAEISPATSGVSKLQTCTSRHVVRSSKLENWNRKTGSGSALSLSDTLKDKTKSMFNSNSLARYTFDFTITLPEEVRLLQAGAIPLLVDAIPVREQQHTTIEPNNYPDVKVDNISLELTAHTFVRFKSLLRSNAKVKHEIKLLNRHPVDHIIDVMKTTQMLGDDEEGIQVTHVTGTDLSKLPGLSLSLGSAKMDSRQIERPLVQTFSTYIIAREYSINYKLELDVAGEKVRVVNETKIPLRVLAPDDDDLATFLHNSGVATAICEDDPADLEGNSESEDIEDADETECNKERGLLSRLSSRRSKAQEAAGETAASSSRGTATQFRSDEDLPTYQANPTNFGFRNEIDERPPRYEAD